MEVGIRRVACKVAIFTIHRKSGEARIANRHSRGESDRFYKLLKYGQFQMMMHGFTLDFRSARL